MDNTLTTKLIAEMKRVRDVVMPAHILDEYRGSRVATEALTMIRDLLDQGTAALASQDSEKALDVYGELKAVTA